MTIIFSDDFIDYTPSARVADASYPATNVAELWHLIRVFKSTGSTANDWLLKLDMASAQAVAAIVLNHVNFESVTIQGNDIDVWTSPAFTDTVSIVRDPAVNRYKAFIPLTSFNYRYLRIFIPSGQTPANGSVWYVGSVVLLASYTSLARQPATISRTADIPFNEVEIGGRVVDIVPMGTLLGWSGSISFSSRRTSDESELWTLNSINPGSPMILYDDLDTAAVYCVRKVNWYEGKKKGGRKVSGNSIDFEEIGI